MKTLANLSSQKGFVIVISLILLLVMTTMGMGLVYTTGRNDKGAQGTINRTESLHSAETCIQGVVWWLEDSGLRLTKCKNKGDVCYRETEKTMGHSSYAIAGANVKFKNKMNQHRNKCEVSLLTTLSDKALGLGAGFEVGQNSTYGGSTPNTKYLYKIKSQGTGPNNSVSNIEIIASIID